MAIKIDIDFDSLEKLEKHIGYVKKCLTMQKDKVFQSFIQDKVLKLATEITDKLLVGGTSNDEAIGIYKSSHHIQEENDGFILYNNAKIPANVKGVQNDVLNYPNGEFSIALAFEYGVGIVGQNTNSPNHWTYNLNNYNFGWYLPSDVTGQSGIQTSGYEGFEIYRNIAIEVDKRLKDWVEEYFSKGE